MVEVIIRVTSYVAVIRVSLASLTQTLTHPHSDPFAAPLVQPAITPWTWPSCPPLGRCRPPARGGGRSRGGRPPRPRRPRRRRRRGHRRRRLCRRQMLRPTHFRMQVDGDRVQQGWGLRTQKCMLRGLVGSSCVMEGRWCGLGELGCGA